MQRGKEDMAKKVLICDMNLRDRIAKLFGQKKGYQAITLRTGRKGLTKPRDSRPISLDVMMPEKSGFEVCQEFERDERTKGIYIIILTARGEESIRRGQRNRGRRIPHQTVQPEEIE